MRFVEGDFGLAYELPAGWTVTSAGRAGAHYVTVQSDGARTMVLSLRPGEAGPGLRAEMIEHLKRIGASEVRDAADEASSGESIFLDYQLDQTRQRWIGLVRSGVRFHLSHDGAWEQVRTAAQALLDTLSAVRVVDLAAWLERTGRRQHADGSGSRVATHGDLMERLFNIPPSRPPSLGERLSRWLWSRGG